MVENPPMERINNLMYSFFIISLQVNQDFSFDSLFCYI